MAERVEHLLRESQCGFRKGHGCIDQIFTLCVLVEKAGEFNTPLYLDFVDLRKAYDSINQDTRWMVLQRRYTFPRSWFAVFVCCTMAPEEQRGHVAGCQKSLILPLVSERVTC